MQKANFFGVWYRTDQSNYRINYGLLILKAPFFSQTVTQENHPTKEMIVKTSTMAN
jgi:hypothetical protein